mmetsp:Transcript_42266/g.68547  ORF Transcript_42266/g.68547 Transcript_42266/m.68547 type:complete len:219 (+) Transcript_42266:1085-1741(+)
MVNYADLLGLEGMIHVQVARAKLVHHNHMARHFHDQLHCSVLRVRQVFFDCVECCYYGDGNVLEHTDEEVSGRAPKEGKLVLYQQDVVVLVDELSGLIVIRKIIPPDGPLHNGGVILFVIDIVHHGHNIHGQLAFASCPHLVHVLEQRVAESADSTHAWGKGREEDQTGKGPIRFLGHGTSLIFLHSSPALISRHTYTEVMVDTGSHTDVDLGWHGNW